MTTNTGVHTCSYYCERPECVRRQRDELRDRMESALAQQPPSAPVGVEGLASAARCLRWLARDASPEDAAEAEAHANKLDALAQQPAAGEEIMVNAAHDVFTLPLQPSGLTSGPRFVVHVPAPEQQPAAVDEAWHNFVADLVGPAAMRSLRRLYEEKLAALRAEAGMGDNYKHSPDCGRSAPKISVSEEIIMWCKDTIEALEEAGGPTNNSRAYAIRRVVAACNGVG